MNLLRAIATPADVSVFMTMSGATFSKSSTASHSAYEALYLNEGLRDIVTLHQIHSTSILQVSSANQRIVEGSDGDGLFTSETGLAIGILTADCYPVIVVGERCMAALHCGWRGAVNGIINKAAHLFEAEGDRPQYAYIGAGISREAFAVKEDFIEAVSALIDSKPYLFNYNNGWHFDLKSFVVDRLRDIAVETVETANRCTFSSPAFHSYRRDGKAAGRMLTVAYRTS